MKEITQEQLETLRKAYDATKGTNEYCKYSMEHSFKKSNGTWRFIGWGIPIKNYPVVLKTYKGKKYLYQEDERFTVCASVEYLLGI